MPLLKNSNNNLVKGSAFDKSAAVWNATLFSAFDIDLFLMGKHFRLYEKMGAKISSMDGQEGVYFAVWAPNALKVSVMGSFNGWDQQQHVLNKRWDSSGIWEGFIPQVKQNDLYKYAIKGFDGIVQEKADPFAWKGEMPPHQASIVWQNDYQWKDQSWLKKRPKLNALNQPISVYELHLGSWQRDPSNPDRILNFREIALSLVPYLLEMGFTHVEFLPVMDFPYQPSWGYQITGFFATSAHYGTAQDLMFLVNALHQAHIAVILDWVPSHFPGDLHGLYQFDGTHLYEHPDPLKGFQPDWGTYIFNYEKPEVRAFLISNAMFWMDFFHIDGLRVDAVASMLYYDFTRPSDQAAKNQFGGNENLGAIQFLKDFNEAIYGNFKGVQTIAEESSTYNGVTRPVFANGLGFGMKWMMGWMNDTLKYLKDDPIHRKYNQNLFSFSLTYAFTENFMLPFSHDEVVHGKSPMLYKMPGDEWQKFANLRMLYAYMFTHPGAKLLFMGDEFGATSEWDYSRSLDWHLLQYAPHLGMQKTVKALNFLYRNEPALYKFNFSSEGFEWIDADNADDSVFIYMRKATKKETLIVVINATPVARTFFKVGVPLKGKWSEIFNSDAEEFYGSGKINPEPISSAPISCHHQKNSISITLPPLAVSIFKRK